MVEVASKNKYSALFEDASDAPELAPKLAETTKPEAPAAKPSRRGRPGPASKSGRYYQRGGGAPSAPREVEQTEDATPLREGKRFENERGRGRGRGGRARGERGRGGHGRVFDRHSATGRVDTEKKVSQGWGADGTEKEAEEEGQKDAAAESAADDPWGVSAAAPAAVDDWGVTSAENTEDAPKEAAPVENRRREEEEDNTLTYDEYLAKQKEKATVPKLENVRKPNDGEDDLFKDVVPVEKDSEDAYFPGKTRGGRQRKKNQDTKKEFIPIDVPISGPRGRGGRGGDRGFRGGGRGRGARGRGRSDGVVGSVVNVDDENAFPALSPATT